MSIDNTQDAAEPSPASAGSRGGGFNQWLVSIGKSRETATDADEIQWLRLDRQRLRLAIRLNDEERAVLSMLGTDTREHDKYSNGRPWFVTVEQAKTIRGLLERLA